MLTIFNAKLVIFFIFLFTLSSLGISFMNEMLV